MSAIYIHAGAVAGGINELKSVLLQLMHPMKPGGSAAPGRVGLVVGDRRGPMDESTPYVCHKPRLYSQETKKTEVICTCFFCCFDRVSSCHPTHEMMIPLTIILFGWAETTL